MPCCFPALQVAASWLAFRAQVTEMELDPVVSAAVAKARQDPLLGVRAGAQGSGLPPDPRASQPPK
jgi:hypothetical protein